MNNIPPPIIRQPPPPPPLTPADRTEEKINTEMVGGNNRSTHKRLTEIDSLPDEVLLDIIFRLEAQDIYDSARFVCSKWYHMTHTHTSIYAHLQRSTYGLLFESKSGDLLFMAVGESGRIEISKLSYKLRWPLVAGCNGLLLELEGDKNTFYVSNPTTRQNFALPAIVGYELDYEIIAIAYAAASMEYKVVILAGRMCRILTIGVDNSWRTLGSSLETKEYFRTTLVTEGFLHFYHEASNEVLTMNVETEIITETTCPKPRVVYGNRGNFLLSTGRYLSLLRQCGKFCWEVWEMKPKIDYQWRKVCDISLKAHNCSTFQQFDIYHDDLFPIGWLKYPEVLVFSKFVFNLLTQEIVIIELPRRYYIPVVHKNSLVWFDRL